MIFTLLLCPLFMSAQRNNPDSIFLKSIPVGLGKTIHLPELRWHLHFSPDKNFDFKQRALTFIVTSDSVYHNLFKDYHYTQDSLRNYHFTTYNFFDSLSYNRILRYLSDSLPVIDFARQELILYSACEKCLEVCNHKDGGESCHRAACNFRDAWFIREKEPLIVQMRK